MAMNGIGIGIGIGIGSNNSNSLLFPSTRINNKDVVRVQGGGGGGVEEIPPNALLRKRNSRWRGGFSLGVDLGMSRTGLALSKGFSIRPLNVPLLFSYFLIFLFCVCFTMVC